MLSHMLSWPLATAVALPPLSEIGFSFETRASKSHNTELQRSSLEISALTSSSRPTVNNQDHAPHIRPLIPLKNSLLLDFPSESLTPVCEEITKEGGEQLEQTELKFIFPASQTLVPSSPSLSLYYFSLSVLMIYAARSGSMLFFWLCGAELVHSLERESFHEPVYASVFMLVQAKYLCKSIYEKK